MNVDEELAERAEQELQDLKNQVVEQNYQDDSRSKLWAKFREWIDHPVFGHYPGMLRSTVLNELQFCLSHDPLIDETWQLLGELAERWERDSLGGLMDAIRIASFECIAEPPEDPENLKKLFELAANPHKRWAVFAAYEHVPWRLRPHAHKYSDGQITDDDCDDWLSDRHGEDEVLMLKPRSY